MTREEYIENMKEDIRDYINENYSKKSEIDWEELYDVLFVEDCVTGNASGSYYCNSYNAKEALGWDIEDKVEEIEFTFGEIPNERRYDWEYIDVSYRCVLLGEALEEVKNEDAWIDEEEEEE